MKQLIKRLFPPIFIAWLFNQVAYFAIEIYPLIYRPFIIRKNTSDIDVFKNIFLLRELNLPVTIKPLLIIDAGSYTGLSTLFYSTKYPKAKIIAVEPEFSNYEVLQKHTKNRKNISLIQAGLWPKKAFLKISERSTGKWGLTVNEVSEQDDYDIKAVTLDEILENSGFTVIDILKIDIEGSEKEVFSSNSKSWLDKVNIIVIELHDRIKNGCSQSLYSAIDMKEWNEFKEGEKVVLIRKNQLKNEPSDKTSGHTLP